MTDAVMGARAPTVEGWMDPSRWREGQRACGREAIRVGELRGGVIREGGSVRAAASDVASYRRGERQKEAPAGCRIELAVRTN